MIIKDYFSSFFNDEGASETLEWIAVIAATAVIIAAVAAIVKNIRSKTEDLATNI